MLACAYHALTLIKKHNKHRNRLGDIDPDQQGSQLGVTDVMVVCGDGDSSFWLVAEPGTRAN